MKKTILVIDDEPKIRAMYESLLRTEGYRVMATESAVTANEKLTCIPVDLVLLDIMMPDVDGVVMYDVIRMFHKKTKIIVSSVYPLDEQRMRIIGADDYFDKTHSIETLLRKVQDVLG